MSVKGYTDPKQVIIARKDLKMPPGKLAAQVAHASVACLLGAGTWSDVYEIPGEEGHEAVVGRFTIETPSPAMYHWMTKSFPKACLRVNNELDMLELYQKAKDAGLPCSLIRDSGRTVYNGEHNYTCVGIGPASREQIDAIAGHLKLY